MVCSYRCWHCFSKLIPSLSQCILVCCVDLIFFFPHGDNLLNADTVWLFCILSVGWRQFGKSSNSSERSLLPIMGSVSARAAPGAALSFFPLYVWSKTKITQNEPLEGKLAAIFMWKLSYNTLLTANFLLSSPGHLGFRVCSEGSRAASTKTLWEEAKPGSGSDSGEDPPREPWGYITLILGGFNTLLEVGEETGRWKTGPRVWGARQQLVTRLVWE